MSLSRGDNPETRDPKDQLPPAAHPDDQETYTMTKHPFIWSHIYRLQGESHKTALCNFDGGMAMLLPAQREHQDDKMERQLQEHKEMCKQAEAKTLAFDEMQVKYDLIKAAYHEMKEKLEKYDFSKFNSEV